MDDVLTNIIPVRVICHFILRLFLLYLPVYLTLFSLVWVRYIHMFYVKGNLRMSSWDAKDCLNCNLNLSWICLRVAYPRSRSNWDHSETLRIQERVFGVLLCWTKYRGHDTLCLCWKGGEIWSIINEQSCFQWTGALRKFITWKRSSCLTNISKHNYID